MEILAATGQKLKASSLNIIIDSDIIMSTFID